MEEQESSLLRLHRSPVTHIISVISNQHYYYESFSGTAHSPRLEFPFKPHAHPESTYRAVDRVTGKRVLSCNVSASVKSDDKK